MALKKMGRPMKIITIIIAISMLIPIFLQAYAYFTNRETKTVILKFDGEKIYKEDFEAKYTAALENFQKLDSEIKGANNLTDATYKAIPEDLIKSYVLANMINEKIDILLAKKLGAKVSQKDIETKFKEIEDQVGGSQQLIASLNMQGQTVESFRAIIKQFLLGEKIQETIALKIPLTEEAIEKRFKQLKYSEFKGREFAEVKEEVKKMILSEKGSIYRNSLSEDLFNNANVSISLEEYKPIFDKLREVYFEKGEYKYTYYNILEELFTYIYTSNKGYSEEIETEFKKQTETNLDKAISIKDEALKAGLTLNSELLPLYQLIYIAEEYVSHLIDTYKASDEELQTLFTTLRTSLNIPHTVSGELIALTYKASQEDWTNLENKAKEVLKSITVDNFATKAKELSKDPGSAQNGGDLGEQDINTYVPEFKEALSKANAGEIVGPIKTEFGYHIIYVVSKNKDNQSLVHAKHILLTPEIGDKTKADTKAKLLEIKKEIEENKLTWESIKNDKTGKYSAYIISNFSKITENEALPSIGYSQDINTKLFAEKVGSFLEFEISDAYVLIQKIEDIPFKEVTFDEVKEELENIAATRYAISQISK